ncbi:MAG: SDR family oxidoreductase [Deltaproteobacteria bacterium]|nr:SDR family oxidoreductase [Deltaproteobacteria bacterium]
MKPAPTVEVPEDEWDKILTTTLKSVFIASKYAIPEMLKQGGGIIINTASAGGLVGVSNHSAYCAAKGGVIALTRVLALEYIRQNIRVNCIVPGTVRTPMLNLTPEMEEVWKKRQPIGRIAEPRELAQAALFLASEESSFVVGIPLIVDGGYTAV